MKINIKGKNKTYSVNFLISPGRGETHFSAIAKTSKDLDELQDALLDGGQSDDVLGKIIATAIEKKLKLPVEIDYGYRGAGFGFKLDLYSIAKSLK
jgi:hypothetical protein